MNNSSILELQTWLVYQRVAIDCAGCLCKYIYLCSCRDIYILPIIFYSHKHRHELERDSLNIHIFDCERTRARTLFGITNMRESYALWLGSPSLFAEGIIIHVSSCVHCVQFDTFGYTLLCLNKPFHALPCSFTFALCIIEEGKNATVFSDGFIVDGL